ncbi:hypothetical protein CIK44_07170 [Bacillus sp. X2(2017)]|nr:hypothetical protein CIK44_07170 [Bacillus sp. X2(2017)]
MCGRFTLFSEFDDIIEQFNIDQFLPEDEYHPSYNVTPYKLRNILFTFLLYVNFTTIIYLNNKKRQLNQTVLYNVLSCSIIIFCCIVLPYPKSFPI